MAFAGNSVLCRLALQDQSIDATTFTILRLLSGAITLIMIVWLTRQASSNTQANTIVNKSTLQLWLAPLMLFLYAATFSYAYILLDAGLGALILFGCVQLTMITVSILQGQRLGLLKWLGLVMAFSGLVYLVNAQSGLDEVDFSLTGFVLMMISGIAWAVYTILGKGSQTPLLDTCVNFSKSLVFAIPLGLMYLFVESSWSVSGFVLAIASGAITSGIGYAIWYYALNGLTPVQAGVVQLMVPVIAALGGLIWIGEAITMALVISQLVILGGIALVMFTPKAERT